MGKSKQLIFALIVFGLNYMTMIENTYYQKEKYLNNFNSHIPEWAKMLVELYTSPLKYKMIYDLKDNKI